MIQRTNLRRGGRVVSRWARAMATGRSVRAVIVDHLERRARGDIEGDIIHNYAADVLVLSPCGGWRGADAVRRCGAELSNVLGPDAWLDYEQLWIDGPVGYLEWTASGPWVDPCDGAEALVISDGRIIAQTLHYEPCGVGSGQR